MAWPDAGSTEKRRGSSVQECIENMQRKFGHHANVARNLVMQGIEGKQNIARILNMLRNKPPRSIAGLAVSSFVDLQDETNWLGPFKGATDRAARNFLMFQLGDNARIALRPSGTEPKAKIYVETCSAPMRPGTSAAQWATSCLAVDNLAQRLADEFLLMLS